MEERVNNHTKSIYVHTILSLLQVLEEFAYLSQQILTERDQGKRAHNICDGIDRAVGSIINNLLFGYRYTEKNIAEFEVRVSRK